MHIKNNKNNLELVESGLFISSKYNYLCTSADGIILEKGNKLYTIEIKCPYNTKHI